jgi:hypothetical protein
MPTVAIIIFWQHPVDRHFFRDIEELEEVAV